MRNIALSIIPASLLLTQVTAETVIGINDKNTQLLGVDPALLKRYEPIFESGKDEAVFRCLNAPDITIPYKALNDDFCDCPDGTDEPGTSACSLIKGTKFWCRNEGHEPAWIWSSRVGDGICDPECCDGSDENFSDSGVRCPNTCEETGKASRAAKEAENKIRRTGAKIRSTYISFAKNERKRLVAQISELEGQVETTKDQVESARVRLERLESADKEEIEKRQKTPLYLSFLEHRQALAMLRQNLKQIESERDELKAILKELKDNYNPNYQDMAVKAAVVGYSDLVGESEGDGAESEYIGASISPDQLDALEKVDLINLVMSGDDLAKGNEEDGEEESLLYRLDQYVPDSLYDSYESVRDTMISYLIKFGLIGGKARAAGTGSEAAHTVEARKTFTESKQELEKLERELTAAHQSVEKLTGDFGPEAEWKKLEGTCIEKEQGDYTYSLCFFGQASQKSNRDGAKHNLGTYAGWNASPEIESGTEKYYSKQLYNRGLKCWNGPDRSVKVDLACGTANELLHISEPEKCEYYFKATTPALCWPRDDQTGKSGLRNTGHAEL